MQKKEQTKLNLKQSIYDIYCITVIASFEWQKINFQT